jgi:hypothetical protein
MALPRCQRCDIHNRAHRVPAGGLSEKVELTFPAFRLVEAMMLP